jgi:glutathione S-transferase
VAVRLITIPFSHYCEKARWALDRAGISYHEDGHLPLFHYLANRRAGAGRTVPVMIDGDKLLCDSTEIVAWADRHAPGSLLPLDAATRDDALALEDDFDTDLGPAARRLAYWFLLPRAKQADVRAAMLCGVPRWQQRVFPFVRPLAAGMLKRGLDITADSVERSRVKLEDTFARVSARLADGRRYLAGDAFSVADLTFAALAAPVLAPPNHPYGVEVSLGPDGDAQRAAWRATAAGEHAMRVYREDRAPMQRAA